ncbi:MAG: hypothetical protein LIO42_03505 [Oscillospiraceae bacterium]|nr:hypothetical protein [Oscillospiraceae bacterium]
MAKSAASVKMLSKEGSEKMLPLDKLRPAPPVETVLREFRRDSIVVKGPDAEGQYRILYGTRIYLAAAHQSASPQEIPCILLGENIDETVEALYAELDLLQLQGESTTDSSQVERCRLKVCKLLCRLSEQGTITYKDIVPLFCEIFKCTQRYARIYIRICRDGIPELQDALISSLTPNNCGKEAQGTAQVHVPAGTLASLCQLPAALQRKALKRISNGESPNKVKQELFDTYKLGEEKRN